MSDSERNKAIQARVSEDEFALIEERASKLGLSISNYVRLVSLHSDIQVNVKIDNIK